MNSTIWMVVSPFVPEVSGSWYNRAFDASVTSSEKIVRMHDDDLQVPHPPYDDLRRSAAGDASTTAQIDELEAHVRSGEATPQRIEAHVDALRGVRDLEARIANWWDDPATQRWVKGLSDAGL